MVESIRIPWLRIWMVRRRSPWRESVVKPARSPPDTTGQCATTIQKVIMNRQNRNTRRTSDCLMALCLVLWLSGCAQSMHQTERLTRSDFAADPGYAGDQYYSYWPGPEYGAGYGIGYGYGPGYWGKPFGYYGAPYGPFGLGWYGGYGGFSGAQRPSGTSGPRRVPPPHAPAQFRKKY